MKTVGLLTISSRAYRRRPCSYKTKKRRCHFCVATERDFRKAVLSDIITTHTHTHTPCYPYSELNAPAVAITPPLPLSPPSSLPTSQGHMEAISGPLGTGTFPHPLNPRLTTSLLPAPPGELRGRPPETPLQHWAAQRLRTSCFPWTEYRKCPLSSHRSYSTARHPVCW